MLVPGSHYQRPGCQDPMSQVRRPQGPLSQFKSPRVPESQGPRVLGPRVLDFRVPGLRVPGGGSQVLTLGYANIKPSRASNIFLGV